MKKKYGWLIGITLFLGIPLISFAQTNLLFKSPVEGISRMLAPFGENRGGYTHEGIDIDIPMLTPLYAVEAGTITKAAPDSKGVNNGGGHMVFIDHGDGIESRYMHMSLYAVKAGDKVEAGDLIGFSGDSGDATKPLLHYELRVNQVPVDPAFIFEVKEEIVEPVVEPFLIPQT